MKKIILNSILKDYKNSFPTIFILAFIISIVFSNLTVQYSQSSYIKDVIEENTTRAQAEFFDINKKQLETIELDKSIKSMSITKSYGKASLKNKILENILVFNEKYFEDFNLKLIEGEYPLNRNEVILEKSILNKYNIELNQEIKIKGNKIINSNKGEKKYLNYELPIRVVGYYTYPSKIKTLYKYQDIFISEDNTINEVVNVNIKM